MFEQAHPVTAPTTTASPVDTDDLYGDEATYAACQAYARAARAAVAAELTAPSAALVPGAARGQHTDGELREAADRDGQVWALYGKRPDLRGRGGPSSAAPRPAECSTSYGTSARSTAPAGLPAADAKTPQIGGGTPGSLRTPTAGRNPRLPWRGMRPSDGVAVT